MCLRVLGQAINQGGLRPPTKGSNDKRHPPSHRHWHWPRPLPCLLVGQLNELALFSGAGGGILGGHLLGWRTVCAVEWEPYPASVLCARQNDGFLPPFPVWDDIRTFDGRPWRGIVQVVSGGFPCQDISAAGKGTGITGSRSGLWGEMARVIREVRPRFCFVENSPMLTSRGLGTVLGDLAAMGFDARWGVLGAADVGAPHQRDRIWIVGKQMGNTYNNGPITSEISKSLAQRSDSSSTQQEQASKLERSGEQYAELAHTDGMRQLQPQGSESDQRGWVGDSGEQVANASEQGLQREQWSQSEGDGDRLTDQGEAMANICDKVSYSDNNGHNNKKSRELFASSEQTETRQEFNETSRHNSLANSSSLGQQRQGQHDQPVYSAQSSDGQANYAESIGRPEQWSTEPNVGRVANGVAARMDRLKAIGNGQVPAVAKLAWEILNT